MLGEKLDIIGLESIVILEGSKKFPAGQLIRELIATVRRCHLLQDVIAPKRNIQPAHASQHRCGKKIFFALTTLQLGSRNTDALAEAQKQCTVAWHRTGRAFEILVTDF